MGIETSNRKTIFLHRAGQKPYLLLKTTKSKNNWFEGVVQENFATKEQVVAFVACVGKIFAGTTYALIVLSYILLREPPNLCLGDSTCKSVWKSATRTFVLSSVVPFPFAKLNAALLANDRRHLSTTFQDSRKYVILSHPKSPSHGESYEISPGGKTPP